MVCMVFGITWAISALIGAAIAAPFAILYFTGMLLIMGCGKLMDVCGKVAEAAARPATPPPEINLVIN